MPKWFAELRDAGMPSIFAAAGLLCLMFVAPVIITVLTFTGPLSHPAGTTCFRSQIDHPQAAMIERATVFIAAVRPDGTLLSEGTGFIVRGSATNDGHGSRIVTAGHVVELSDDLPADTRLMVFFSDGTPLGLPRVVAAAPTRRVSLDGFELTMNDLAVLEIASFSDAKARERFAHVDGLQVRSADRLMVGEASDPAGVAWGYSGAAAIDRDGRVVGVLTGADFRGRVTLNLGAVQEADADGMPLTHPVTLPRRSLVVIEPLGAPEILRELGVSPPRRGQAGETPVVLAGFPLASCAATSARLQSADSSAGVELLSKWQSIGQVGAWFLPPQIDAKKLKLAPAS